MLENFEDFTVVDPNAPVDDNDVSEVLTGPVELGPGPDGEEPAFEVTFDGEEPANVLTFEVTLENVDEVTVTMKDEYGQPVFETTVPVEDSPSTVTLELPEEGVPDVRSVEVVLSPADENAPVVASNLESECCYEEVITEAGAAAAPGEAGTTPAGFVAPGATTPAGVAPGTTGMYS